MAGFGDLALAFAGGAAKQINEDVAAERTSRLRVQERVKEMQMQQRMRQNESEYAAQMKTWEQERVHVQALKSMGGDQLAQQQYIATNIQGRDINSIKQRVKNGNQIPAFAWTPTMTTRPSYKGTTDKEFSDLGKTESSIRKILGIPQEEPEPVSRVAGEEDTQTTGEALRFGGEEADWRQLLEKASPVELVFKDVTNPDGSKSVQGFHPITGKPVGEPQKFGVGGKTPSAKDSPWKATVDNDTGNTTWTNVNTLEVRHIKGIFETPAKLQDALTRFQAQRAELEGQIDQGINVEDNQRRVDELNAQIEKMNFINKPAGASSKESRSLFRHKVSGRDILPSFNPNTSEYEYNGEVIDISEYDPITDEFKTKRAEARIKRVETLRSNMTALGNVQSGIDNYKQVVSEGTTGVTGAIIDVGSAMGATIVGVGELLGVDPSTPEEREKLFAEAGIDINEFISGDQTALRGMVAQDAKQLVYSLAGILKADAKLGRTSVADIQRAADMIKDLGAQDRGVGALASLQSTIDTKKAGVFQEMYQTRGISAKDRTMSGQNLLRITVLSDPAEWDAMNAAGKIRTHPGTGEVFLMYPDGAKSLDQVIQLEGRDSQLRPKRTVHATN